MRIITSLKRRLVGKTLPPFPVEARHIECSLIMSADDDPGRPSDRLIDVALKAAERARTASMAAVIARMKQPPYYPDIWPGEHYKLLAGLVGSLKPAVVIEIGTATGSSALVMRQNLPENGRLYTFDIVPWDQYPGTCLQPEDFADGRLTQIIGDLGDREVMKQHADLVRSADLMFIDGPKDGIFEQRLLAHLGAMDLPKQPVLMFDDVRVWNMLAIWRGIQKPKLDVTSFGHWSGTGLVHWM